MLSFGSFSFHFFLKRIYIDLVFSPSELISFLGNLKDENHLGVRIALFPHFSFRSTSPVPCMILINYFFFTVLLLIICFFLSPLL